MRYINGRMPRYRNKYGVGIINEACGCGSTFAPNGVKVTTICRGHGAATSTGQHNHDVGTWPTYEEAEAAQVAAFAYAAAAILVLRRCDGNWALYAPGTTGEDVASGKARCLGYGRDEPLAGWHRPDENDYDEARKHLMILSLPEYQSMQARHVTALSRVRL